MALSPHAPTMSLLVHFLPLVDLLSGCEMAIHRSSPIITTMNVDRYSPNI
jgi:hypothetical protein